MAIFHLSAHDRVSRSAGQSSVASAAYIMRAQFTDERTGQVYDFRQLDSRPQWMGMFSPKDAPDWTRDAANAERFWNALELFEKRKDAQIALPLDIALPFEMTLQQNIWLAQDYIREHFTRQGYVVLAAIHPPDHDERNIHLHLLISLRKIDAHGFARTKTEQQENYRNRDSYIENLREKWEHLANRHLERHGIDARIDRRTLQEQGIERAAQKHRGPTKSAVVFTQQDRQARAAAEAEIKQLQAQIIDLDAKRAEREARTGGLRQVEPVASPTTAESRTRQDASAETAHDEIPPTKDPKMDQEPPASPSPANQNDRDKALFTASWDSLNAPEVAELGNQLEERQRQGVPFTPGERQPGRYAELKEHPGFAPETIAATSPGEIDRIVAAMPEAQQQTPAPELTAPEAVAAAKADNFRVLSPDQSRETLAAWAASQQPGANQNNAERIALVAEQEGRQTPETAAAPAAAPEPAPGFLGRVASGFIDGLAERFSGFITYLSDLISPPPALTPEQVEQVEDAVQRAQESADFSVYRQYIPGLDPADHQDSETRKTSERDNDRARGIDLEPD